MLKNLFKPKITEENVKKAVERAYNRRYEVGIREASVVKEKLAAHVKEMQTNLEKWKPEDINVAFKHNKYFVGYDIAIDRQALATELDECTKPV